eukprot:ANDGO_04258.mRNA.1 hypothetical protein GUITHDRAFT_108701
MLLEAVPEKAAAASVNSGRGDDGGGGDRGGGGDDDHDDHVRRNQHTWKPQGRYKNLAIPACELREEAEHLFPKLEVLLRMWNSRVLSDGEMAACYILLFLQKRRKFWIGGVLPSSLRPAPERAVGQSISAPLNRIPSAVLSLEHPRIKSMDVTLYELFATFQLKSLPLFVNSVICGWIAGSYPLILDAGEEVPSGLQMLRAQGIGRRIVSMVVQKDRMLNGYIHEKMDAFEFMLHDLAHADRFYRDQQVCNGQVGVFAALERGFDALEMFPQMCSLDAEFDHGLEYVCADMNAYSVHLWKCSKALCLNWFLRNRLLKSPSAVLSDEEIVQFNEFWAAIQTVCCPDMPDDCRVASMAVNTKVFCQEHADVLGVYFEAKGSGIRARARF